MKRYNLKAIEKKKNLFNVIDGNNRLVRAKCTLKQVKELYYNGLCKEIVYNFS